MNQFMCRLRKITGAPVLSFELLIDDQVVGKSAMFDMDALKQSDGSVLDFCFDKTKAEIKAFLQEGGFDHLDEQLEDYKNAPD